MTRFFSVLGTTALLTGCVDIGLDVGIDSGTPGNTNPNAPLEIISGTVDCLDTTTVQYELTTSGPAASAEVYSQETGNVEPQFSDTHNLSPIDGQPGQWERTLETGVALEQATQDASTVFRCDRNDEDLPYHHNAGPALVMSYIFRAYDASFNEFDCVAVGEDPSGIIAGSEDAVNSPTREQDINATDCRVEVFSY